MDEPILIHVAPFFMALAGSEYPDPCETGRRRKGRGVPEMHHMLRPTHRIFDQLNLLSEIDQT